MNGRCGRGSGRSGRALMMSSVLAALVGLSSCTASSTDAANEVEIAERFIQARNAHDVGTARSLLADHVRPPGR